MTAIDDMAREHTRTRRYVDPAEDDSFSVRWRLPDDDRREFARLVLQNIAAVREWKRDLTQGHCLTTRSTEPISSTPAS